MNALHSIDKGDMCRAIFRGRGEGEGEGRRGSIPSRVVFFLLWLDILHFGRITSEIVRGRRGKC